MIRGVHTMFYSSQSEELRAFLRDKLGFPFTDVGGGWMIFDLAEAEMGAHPSDESHAHSRAGMHSISLYCDDIHKTVADLKSKGVEFNNEIADMGYGLVIQFRMPGGVVADLYQPLYKKETAPKPRLTPPAVQAAIDKLLKPAARKKTPKKAKPTAKKKAPPKKAAKKVGKKKVAKKRAKR